MRRVRRLKLLSKTGGRDRVIQFEKGDEPNVMRQLAGMIETGELDALDAALALQWIDMDMGRQMEAAAKGAAL